MRSAAVLSLAILAGCRSQLHYSLEDRSIVRPPVAPKPELILKNARQRNRLHCDVESAFGALRWTGRTAHIRIHPSPAEAGPNVMFTDSLREIENFRTALFAKVTEGCLTGPERVQILSAITERHPLPSLVAYYLRFGTLAQAGFIELTSDFRLKVAAPWKDGYEVSYLSAVAAPGDDRIRLRLDEGPPLLPGLPEGLSYVRILFWTTRSSADHHAAILAAPTRPLLDAATQTFQAQPDASCRTLLPAGASCVAIPAKAAANAQMRVKVNGRDAFVGIAGNVAEAIGRASHPPAGLRIERMFRGRPVPVDFESGRIYELVLLPGDAITVPQR